MSKKLMAVLFILAGIGLMCNVTAPTPDDVPMPGLWWGYVFIGDLPAPGGLVITAHLNGNDNSTANTTTGLIGDDDNYYYFLVSGTPGDNVSFKVCGAWANNGTKYNWSTLSHNTNLIVPHGACGEYNCSTCGECTNALNGSYTVVNLNSNITNHAGTCINFNTNNTLFSCKGNTIDGTGTGYGVYMSGKTNNIIIGCVIKEFGYGVVMESSSDLNTIKNNTIKNNTLLGVSISGNSKFNKISGNKIFGNKDGINLTGVTGNKIEYNEILNNSRYGIFYLSSSSIVSYNRICNNNVSDFDVDTMTMSSGSENICSNPDGWNDNNAVGCSYLCTCVDMDNDGFYGYNSTLCPTGRDCNDNNASVHPGALELCNSIDDDCDSQVDEGFPDIDNDSIADCIDSCIDSDSDGYGIGSGCLGMDCNDNNSNINPGMPEVYYNGLNDDCNSSTIDNDQDGDGFNFTIDCNDTNPGIYPVKDNLYINRNTILCSGFYNVTDSVSDGVIIINANNIVLDCNNLTLIGSNSGIGIKNSGHENVTIRNCNIFNYTYGINLDYSNFNKIFNNKIGNTFRGVYLSYSSYNTLINNTVNSNSDTGIFLYSSSKNNISDNTANNNSKYGIRLYRSTENNIRNNTIGFNKYGIDFYLDSNSNFISGNKINNNTDYGVNFYLSNVNHLNYNAICSDTGTDIYNEATNGGALQDDNNTCENAYQWNDYGDTGCSRPCNCDKDGDGFNTTVCEGTDCNDNNNSIHPGAAEVCNGIDDNCNSQVDEGLPLNVYFRNFDLDGYGNSTNNVSTCNATPPSGYVNVSGDCNDNNNSIHPGAAEVCNGIDDNCDGQVDENACVEPQCDLNNDGIIVCDWNDLMYAYRCFLGVEKNCNVTGFREWSLMKQEYLCFVNIRAY